MFELLELVKYRLWDADDPDRRLVASAELNYLRKTVFPAVSFCQRDNTAT